jgi:hypothetical protein
MLSGCGLDLAARHCPMAILLLWVVTPCKLVVNTNVPNKHTLSIVRAKDGSFPTKRNLWETVRLSLVLKHFFATVVPSDSLRYLRFKGVTFSINSWFSVL